MQTLRPYQVRGIDAIRRELAAGRKRICVVAPTGCHVAGQLLLTADGSLRPVESISIGDRLIGPDANPRTVLQLIRGNGPLYSVRPTKGRPWTVSGDHVLTLVRSKDGTGLEGHIIDVGLREYRDEWSQAHKHIHKLFRVPVPRFPDSPPKGITVDPYFLGILLGDGAISSGVGVCKPDQEIRDEVSKQAEKYGLFVRPAGKGTSTVYFLSSGKRGVAGANPLLNELRALGLLGCTAEEKFVPGAYKTASLDSRLHLLAGLIDSDGSLSGGGYDWVSKSRCLAEDLAFVARSIGLAAYVSECVKTCQGGFSGTYHRVSISGNTAMVPCRIPRKRAPERRQKKDPLVTGFSVEPSGQGDYYGFTLDGDGRYLLDDFTVTHNSGKTTLAASIIHGASAKGNRVLFVAHRRELIDQCVARLREHDLEPGVILAGREPRPDRQVQVASVQTLARREVPPHDILIVDECHHSRARTYQRLVNTAPFVLGLTATPWRTDGKGLGDLFETAVVVARPSDLIRDGYLCPVTGFAYDLPDLSAVKRVGGDYDEAGAANAMSYVGGNIVQRWLDFRPGRTVLFACTVEHSQRMTALFRDAGARAEHLDGKTPPGERASILGRLADGVTEVVCNVGVCTEGWDLPALRCVILARPTQSQGLFLQMAGRALRPADGKTVARIHDHAGCAIRHGPVDLDRDYSLEASTKRDADAAPRTTTCPSCYAIFSPGPRACPACGAELRREVAVRAVNEVEGVEVSMDEVRRRYVPGNVAKPAFLELKRQGEEKGYRDGWASVRFKERYGFWPRKEWK